MNASRLDVQVKTGNRVTHIYDFKFNCKKDPEISENQRKKYQKRFTGAAVICVDVGQGDSPLQPEQVPGAEAGVELLAIGLKERSEWQPFRKLLSGTANAASFTFATD